MIELYNRYISGAWPDPSQDPPSFQPTQPIPPTNTGFTDLSSTDNTSTMPQDRNRNQGPLKGLLGGNFRLPEFDADTILLLVLVYFLVADDTENISDTLLIIGVLLLLGF